MKHYSTPEEVVSALRATKSESKRILLDTAANMIEAYSKQEAVVMAQNALREQEERSKGCEYCRGKEALYQHTNNTKLYLNTFGEARTLVTECVPCPPYSDCSMRGVPARSAFIIEYCPNCGRKLEVEG